MTHLLFKSIGFAISLLFLVCGFVYSDVFYYFVSLVSFLISILALFFKKSVALSIKIPHVLIFKKSLDKLLKYFKSKNHHVSEKQIHKISIKKELTGKSFWTVIGFSLILFTVMTIYLLPQSKGSHPVIVKYYLSYAQAITNYSLLFLLSVALIVFLIAGYLFKKKTKYTFISLLHGLSKKFVTYFIAFILSFHLSLGLTYLFAVGQVSYVTFGYNSKIIPAKIVTDSQEIEKRIKSSKSLPGIVYYDYPYKKSVVLMQLSPKENFYGKNVVNTLPNDVYEVINVSSSSILLVNDKLLITELKEDTLERLSPTIGKILVALTFQNKNIKSEPKVVLLNRQDYLKLREEQINKEVKKLDDEIASIDQEIYSAQVYIAEGKKQLQEAKTFLANADSEKAAAMNECKNAGENFMGQFYRYYTDEQCNSLNSEWDNAIKELPGQIAEIQSTLNHNQQVFADYQAVRVYIVEARNFVDGTKDSTPHELGIFLPKKDIKIALDSNAPDTFKAYLATLVHEYLHYTSFISEERMLDPFFEEGLTEYFARKVVKKQLGYSENVGYPVAVKLIAEISKKIPEDKLLEIYLTKDQKQLEYLLNEAYGKNFYNDSYSFFATINYLPLDKALKAANTIMVRIDGKKLTTTSVQ